MSFVPFVTLRLILYRLVTKDLKQIRSIKLTPVFIAKYISFITSIILFFMLEWYNFEQVNRQLSNPNSLVLFPKKGQMKKISTKGSQFIIEKRTTFYILCSLSTTYTFAYF